MKRSKKVVNSRIKTVTSSGKIRLVRERMNFLASLESVEEPSLLRRVMGAGGAAPPVKVRMS